jgi:hypothetical protein
LEPNFDKIIIGGWRSEMPDIILEEDHPRIISAKLVEIGSVSEEKIF